MSTSSNQELESCPIDVSSTDSLAPYHCVGCLHPCASLYRTLGRGNVIKLSPCVNCKSQAVDPYCEREWLLVVLDLVLLRQAAYRHVLWNRGQLLATMDAAATAPPGETLAVKGPLEKDHHTTNFTIQKLFQVAFLTTPSTNINNNALYRHIPRFLWTASLLRAHIGMVSTQDRVAPEHTWQAATGFVQLAVVSVMGYILQIAALVLLMGHISSADNGTTSSTSSSSKSNNNNIRRRKPLDLICVLALAVLLPSMGNQTVTALSLLWENSSTVRMLGTVLHQCMSVWTVLQVQLHRKSSIRAVSVMAGAVLFLLLSLFLRALTMMTLQASAPCPGLGWERDHGRILCFA